jgi:hypothetical protein
MAVAISQEKASYCTEAFSATPQILVDIFAGSSAFTGTIFNASVYPGQIAEPANLFQQTGSLGQIAVKFLSDVQEGRSKIFTPGIEKLQRKETKKAIATRGGVQAGDVVTTTVTMEKVLEQWWENAAPNNDAAAIERANGLRIFVDAGSMLINQSSRESVVELARFIDSKKISVTHIEYFDTTLDSFSIISVSDVLKDRENFQPQKLLLESQRARRDQTFTFLDAPRATGSDPYAPRNCVGLMTFNPFALKLDSFLQAVMRLRKFLEPNGQSLDILMAKDAAEQNGLLDSGGKVDPTRMLALAIKTTADDVVQQRLHATLLQIHERPKKFLENEFRVLREKIAGEENDERKKLIEANLARLRAHAAEIFLDREDFSLGKWSSIRKWCKAEKTYGELWKQEIARLDVCLKAAWPDADPLGNEAKARLGELNLAVEEQIQKASGSLQTLGGVNDAAGSIVEVVTQQQQEAQQEQQTELELEIQSLRQLFRGDKDAGNPREAPFMPFGEAENGADAWGLWQKWCDENAMIQLQVDRKRKKQEKDFDEKEFERKCRKEMHPYARTIERQLEIVNPPAPTHRISANPSVFYKNCAELWGGDFTKYFYGSPNFFQTYERPQTIFGESQMGATHLFVVWNPSNPSEYRCCFLATIDVTILKEAIEKNLKNCYLCTCDGIPEVSHPGGNPVQISAILAKMQWVAHFFSGDAAYLEKNQQMTAELYGRIGMPAEGSSDVRKVWLDNTIKFLALRAQNEQGVLRDIKLSSVITNGKQRDDGFAMQLAEAGLSPTATAEQLANILEKRESVSDDVLIRIIARCPSLTVSSKVTEKMRKLIDNLLSQNNPNQEHLRVLCELPDAALLDLAKGNIAGLVAKFSDQRIGQIEDIKLAAFVADGRLRNLKCGDLLVKLFEKKVSGKKITSGSIDHYSDGQILHLLGAGKFSKLLDSLSKGRIGEIENPDLVAKLDAAQCAHVDFAKFTEEQLVQLSGAQLKYFPKERCAKIENKKLLLRMPKELWEDIIINRKDDQILELIADNKEMLDSLSPERIGKIESFDLIRELKDDQCASINWRNFTEDQLVQLPETKLKYILGKIDGIVENKNLLFILWKHKSELRKCFLAGQFKIMVAGLSDSDKPEVYKQTSPELLVKLDESLIRKILHAWDQKAIGGLSEEQLLVLIDGSGLSTDSNEPKDVELIQHIATSFNVAFASKAGARVAAFLWAGDPKLQTSIDPLLIFGNGASVKKTTAATVEFLEATYGRETAAIFSVTAVDMILGEFQTDDDSSANLAVDKFLKNPGVGDGSNVYSLGKLLFGSLKYIFAEKWTIQGKDKKTVRRDNLLTTARFMRWLIQKIQQEDRQEFASLILTNLNGLRRKGIHLPFFLNNSWLLCELQKLNGDQVNQLFTNDIKAIIDGSNRNSRSKSLIAIQNIVKDVRLPDEILAAFSGAISALEEHRNYSELDGIKKTIEAQQKLLTQEAKVEGALPPGESKQPPAVLPTSAFSATPQGTREPSAPGSNSEGPPETPLEKPPTFPNPEIPESKEIPEVTPPRTPPGAEVPPMTEQTPLLDQGLGGPSPDPSQPEGPPPGPGPGQLIPEAPTPGIRTSKQKMLFGFSILLFILAAGAVIIGAVCLLWPIIIGIGIYIIGSAALVFLIASIACYVSSRPSTADV